MPLYVIMEDASVYVIMLLWKDAFVYFIREGCLCMLSWKDASVYVIMEGCLCICYNGECLCICYHGRMPLYML